MSRRPRSVLSVLLVNGGPVTGYRAGLFVAQWLIVSQVVGHPATMEEYWSWWLVSEATAWRARRTLAKSLPEGVEVARVLEAVWRDAQERRSRYARKDLGRAVAELSSLDWAGVVA